MTEANEPRRAMKAPPRARWGRFLHLLARHYQNYQALLLKAARRKKGRALDIDAQESIEKTPWALHWPTVGKNKLHDPLGKIGKNRRIDTLTDEEIDRLEGPQGQSPNRLSVLLAMAWDRRVRVEVEAKTTLDRERVKTMLNQPKIKKLNEAGLLQFKTLAFMGAPEGPVRRLTPIHDAGGTTILSFTGFRKKGISKKDAWPVTDYVRGRAKWIP